MASANDIFTSEERALAERIITHIRREAAKKYSYIQNAVFYLNPVESADVKYIGINYRNLYYNPVGVIELFESNKTRLETAVIHGILHCLLLHPSIGTTENELFDIAADITVNAMLENVQSGYSCRNRSLLKDYNCGSAIELYNAALTNNMLRKKINCISGNKYDDHCVWRFEETEANSGGADDGKEVWKQMLSAAQASCSKLYGNGSGNIFAPLNPPDRFSRFSYKEYLRRFAKEELSEEDPEAIDMLLYTTSMEMYGDMPIVEWNPMRERSNPSDIIIAIDMSGSCYGEIAANFLRQVYTLFDEMNIKNDVNIHTVFFDTEILAATIIRNKNDADKFISQYLPRGFGGTDFKCVFNYADEFKKKSKGKGLKGLFFFSDAYGVFPSEKKPYPTTFFVPHRYEFSDGYMPEWIELVRYDD